MQPRNTTLALLLTLSLCGGIGCAGGTVATVDDRHPLAGAESASGAALTALPTPGHLTIVEFTASWCAPCAEASDSVTALGERFENAGVALWIVSVDGDPALAQHVQNQIGSAFDVFWDGQRQLQRRYGVVALPTTVLLDSNGAVISSYLGSDLDELEAAVEHHLARAAQIQPVGSQ